MKLGVLEEKAQEVPPWFSVLAQDTTETVALQTVTEGTRINSAGHGKRSLTPNW